MKLRLNINLILIFWVILILSFVAISLFNFIEAAEYKSRSNEAERVKMPPQPGEPGHVPTELDRYLDKIIKRMISNPIENISAGEFTGSFPLKWRIEPGARVSYSQGQHFIAPDIIASSDGRYRMYYRVGQDGIGSAISDDGYIWQIEKGLRLSNWINRDGQLVNVSHPWALKLANGRTRLFYQAKVGSDEHAPFLIMSAVSQNGVDFEREEGIRIKTGEETNVYCSGHGRTWQRADSTFLMLFSGTPNDRPGPANLMLAKSSDGLNWQVIDQCIYEGGHDPTVAKLDNGWIAALFHPVGEKGILYMVKFSKDGISWTPAQELIVLSRDGHPITTRGNAPIQAKQGPDIGGDPSLFIFPDGTMRIYAIGDYGIVSFIPAE